MKFTIARNHIFTVLYQIIFHVSRVCIPKTSLNQAETVLKKSLVEILFSKWKLVESNKTKTLRQNQVFLMPQGWRPSFYLPTP